MRLLVCIIIYFDMATFSSIDEMALEGLQSKGFTGTEAKYALSSGITTGDANLTYSALSYLDSTSGLDIHAEYIFEQLQGVNDEDILDIVYANLSRASRVIKSRYGCEMLKHAMKMYLSANVMNRVWSRGTIQKVCKVMGQDFSVYLAYEMLALEPAHNQTGHPAGFLKYHMSNMSSEILYLIHRKWQNDSSFKMCAVYAEIQEVVSALDSKSKDRIEKNSEKIIVNLRLQIDSYVKQFCDKYGTKDLEPYDEKAPGSGAFQNEIIDGNLYGL